MEDLELLLNELAYLDHLVGERGVLGDHVGLGGADGGWIVVLFEGAISHQPGTHGLVAAVHRHKGQVAVDDQVGFRSPTVDLYVNALGSGAQKGQPVRLFSVVVVAALRVKLVDNLVAELVPDLILGHRTVESRRDDEVNIGDPVVPQQLQHDLGLVLAHIRAAHGRQRHGQIVHGDGHLHTRTQHGVQGLAAQGVVDGVANGGLDVVQRRHRRLGVHDPRAHRQVVFLDPGARKEGARLGAVVDRDNARVRGLGHSACFREGVRRGRCRRGRGSRCPRWASHRPWRDGAACCPG